MNSKQLSRMMKQLGINVEEIEDVEEVIIRTASREIVFKDAEVTIMEAQGSKTYQVTGTAEEAAREDAGPDISAEDVELVAQQAGVSEEAARAALEAADGQPAEAIINLMED